MLLVLVGTGILVGAAGEARVKAYREAHETGVDPLEVGSTAAGGGQLRVEHDFTERILVTESARVQGFVLYTATDPSIEPAPDVPAASLFPLVDGTTVRFEVLALDPTVGVKVKGTQLLEPGDSEVFGPMPTLHFHPEWQLTLAEGVVECGRLTFRLVPESDTYTTSDDYTVTITTDPDGECPGDAEPTPTSAATPAPGACGDADGNGVVDVIDAANVLRAAVGLASACGTAPARCDANGSGGIDVIDAANVLRSAVALAAALDCPGF